MKELIGRQGFIRGILGLAVLILIAYIGITFGKPYYRYYSLGSHTRDLLKLEVRDVISLKKNIMKEADNLKIPLNENNLDVNIDIKKDLVSVKAYWTETVDFWGIYQREFEFVMEEEY